MANIQERRDKNGKLISYSIRVHRGRGADGKQLKPWTATFEVQPTWTEKSARKKAEAFAATFERDCKAGVTSDSRQRFSAYCDYVISLKEQRGVKHSTIVRYRELTDRIYPAIGHLKLKEIRADHLNTFYSDLEKPGVRKGPKRATAKIDLKAALNAAHLKQIDVARQTGLAINSVYAAVRGQSVNETVASGIAGALGIKPEKAFTIQADDRPLSAKTILEYHGLISAVLKQAVQESLVPFNVASRATLPKAERKDPTYYQPEQVEAIRDALEDEPIKWKVLVHLMLITGARRGELLGLKWDNINFKQNRIRICNNLLYASDCGIYEDTPKTDKSDRVMALPEETMQLLKEYRAWQCGERVRLGKYYNYQGFLFTKDNGDPMHPDTPNCWLNKFSARHGLPHIHPHAFRHTMASLLYFNKADSVSISKRLGHSKVSTTQNIYAHIIEQADQMNADILADVILKKA